MDRRAGAVGHCGQRVFGENRVQEAQERLSARKKQRDASEENLRLATARYEVGAGDIIEMTDAQAQMVRSETDTINTAFDFAVSYASLLRAMGR